MAKKIVKVEEAPKKKSNIDINKIGKVINENRDTIEMVAEILLEKKSKKTTKRSTSRKTKKTSKSKSNKSLDAIDLLSSLLKK